MKKSTMFTLTILIIFTLLLTACSPGVKLATDKTTEAKSFMQLFPTATYEETAISKAEAELLSDSVKKECNLEDVPESYAIASYSSDVAKLKIYVQGKENIFCKSFNWDEAKLQIEKGNSGDVAENVLVTVNDQELTKEMLQQAVSLAQQNLQDNNSQVDVDAVLNSLVNQMVLQQAYSQEPVTSEEIEEALLNLAKAYNFESIAVLGEQEGVDLELLRQDLKANIQLQKYYEDNGVYDFEVQDSTLKDLYVANTNSFVQGEQVSFRHIYVAEEEAAKNIYSFLEQGEDFCLLEKKYSLDESAHENCGAYTVGRGVLDPILESAVFKLELNKTAIVPTGEGFQIIEVLQHNMPSVLPYEQAAEQLRKALLNDYAQQRINLLILKERASSDIVSYIN